MKKAKLNIFSVKLLVTSSVITFVYCEDLKLSAENTNDIKAELSKLDIIESNISISKERNTITLK